MSRLTRAIKEEIAKEILKGFKLKTPEEFVKEIEAIAFDTTFLDKYKEA